MNIEFSETGLPFINPRVWRTDAGTPFLKEPGVAMIARPHVDISGIQGFLDEFDDGLCFKDYLKDPTDLPPAEQLAKFLGQACYLSYGPGRTWNVDAKKYFDNIMSSGHGSVVEHPNFTFFVWGIDRSVTHELVRHRAGTGFSQVSQRYVDGTKLRFCQRPEYQLERIEDWTKSFGDNQSEPCSLMSEQFREFGLRIDRSKEDYDRIAKRLIRLMELGHPMLQVEKRTDRRKAVNQVARECLPNCAEAPIGVTTNVRALRHIIEMRANVHAEVLIREVAVRMLLCVKEIAPILFADHEIVDLGQTGTRAVQSSYRKV